MFAGIGLHDAADVKTLLEGKNKELAQTLEQRMWQYSDEGKFELAAKYRDLHRTVLALGETQKMATTADRDIDIIGFYREKQRLALQLFTMHEGRIVGRREFFWEDLADDDSFDATEFLGLVLTRIIRRITSRSRYMFTRILMIEHCSSGH